MPTFPLQVLPQPMPETKPKPSTRLLRAAAAERTDIARQRDRLQAKRETLAAKLHEIDASLATLQERETLLGRLAPASEEMSSPALSPSAGRPVMSRVVDHPAVNAPGDTKPDDSRTTLRGPAIRELAVSLLAHGHADALHYRAWYELLVSAGYRVAGKDPLAVFLTQLSRSPVVRKTTQAGVYEIDRDAPARLARRLSKLRTELMQAAGGSSTNDLGELRDQREKLLNDIRHTERALEEAERVLGPGADVVAAPPLRAAG